MSAALAPLLALLLAAATAGCGRGAHAATLRAPAVRKGDIVRFVSPASSPLANGGTVESHTRHMRAQAASVFVGATFGAHAWARDGYLAGSDAQRAADLNAAFAANVPFVVATRGGWGCARLLDALNYTAFAARPSVVMGYSDVTALVTALYARTRVVTLHGAMGIDTWQDSDNGRFIAAVAMRGETPTYSGTSGTVATLRGGRARGRLIGGNLSVFTALLGSPYVTDALRPRAGEALPLLFLEDVHEAVYAIDRMLVALKLANVLSNSTIAGFVWGTCSSCSPSSPGFSVRQVLEQHVAPLGVPAYMGAQFGHISQQMVLPIGANVEIDADAHTITMLEPAVDVAAA